jgi:purine-cytosine permease-like protein
MARRIRFRPPGLKPTTKIGTLGPYRGRLGLGWVVAPIVVGALLLIAVGIYFLAR